MASLQLLVKYPQLPAILIGQIHTPIRHIVKVANLSPKTTLTHPPQ